MVKNNTTLYETNLIDCYNFDRECTKGKVEKDFEWNQSIGCIESEENYSWHGSRNM